MIPKCAVEQIRFYWKRQCYDLYGSIYPSTSWQQCLIVNIIKIARKKNTVFKTVTKIWENENGNKQKQWINHQENIWSCESKQNDKSLNISLYNCAGIHVCQWYSFSIFSAWTCSPSDSALFQKERVFLKITYYYLP